MALYPDNVNQGNRVQSLCGDIARFQATLKQNVLEANRHDQTSLTRLKDVAHKAGYKSPDEFLEAGNKLLTPEQRASLENMKNQVTKLDSDMETTHLVFRGMIATGVPLIGAKFAALNVELDSTQALVFGIQALVRGVYKAITHGVQAAAKFFNFGKVTLNLAVNIAQRGGNVSIGLGVILDGAALIAEAIIGDQQREALQKAIQKLCCHRFISKQLEIQAKIIADYHSNVRGYMLLAQKRHKAVADKSQSPEDAGQELAEDVKLVQDLRTELSKLNLQDCFDQLKKHDEDTKAWTNEDASFSEIMAYIDQHEELTGKA